MPQRKRGLRPHDIDLRPLELVERSLLGPRQQRERRVGRSNPLLGLRRGEGTLGSPAGLRRQRDRAFQEGGRGAQPGARLRAAGRLLELGGNLLVRAERSMRAVPCTAIGIELRIRDLRQSPMYVPPLAGGSGVVDRRTKKRMTERDTCAHRDQVGRLRRRSCLDRNPELGCGSPQKHGIADRFGRTEEQQALGLRG